MQILVAEDDRKIARFVQTLLTEEGYTVDGASDGQTALAQAGTLCSLPIWH